MNPSCQSTMYGEGHDSTPQYTATSGDIVSGLTVRHDHGSQYTADDFQDELAFLGMTTSPS